MSLHGSFEGLTLTSKALQKGALFIEMEQGEEAKEGRVVHAVAKE